MRVSLSSLQKYIDLKDKTSKEIGEALTSLGLECEEIIEMSPTFEGVVLAKVLKTERHPSADRLTVASVNDGTETLQIVCGAPNCREGIYVALAKIGATLFDAEKKEQWTIKKSLLRGVESCGMLCSEEELGIASTHSGILELDGRLPLGSPLAPLFKETIFVIGLTPNLGHCLSAIGIARELKAFFNKILHPTRTHFVESKTEKTTDAISITIENSALCSSYSCRMVRGVKVGPSPDFLKTALRNYGLRSINNVVDIGNYVMLELGQPLHLFDYKKIPSKKITVRECKEKQTFKALDGKEYTLDEDILVIADGKEPLAIAGVMGSSSTAVDETTEDVLIESALFCASAIRKSCRKTGIRSESSHRFERGIDPLISLQALDLAADLLVTYASATVCEGRLQIIGSPYKPKIITCRVDRANAFLGLKLSVNEVKELFTRLEIRTLSEENTLLKVEVPSYRNDLAIEEDLFEEIARLYGYNNLPLKDSAVHYSRVVDSPLYTFENQLREKLIALGLQEWITCDLVSPKESALVCCKKEFEIPVLRPSSIDQSILRTSLFASMASCVQKNAEAQIHSLRAFEIGKVHFMMDGLPKEELMAGIILTGENSPHHFQATRSTADFYTLKGVVENLLHTLHIKEIEFEASNLAHLHPHAQTKISAQGLNLGFMGQIDPRFFETKEKLFFAELNVELLLALFKKMPQFKLLPKFPGSERDRTFTIKEETKAADLLKALDCSQFKFVEKVDIHDIYKSQALGNDRKNVTLRFYFRDNGSTIETEKVDEDMQNIEKVVKSLPYFLSM